MGALIRKSGVRAASGDVGNTLGRRLGAGARATAAKLSGWPRTRLAASKCHEVVLSPPFDFNTSNHMVVMPPP